MYKVECHCKSVKLQVNLPNILDNLVKCNCSICQKRGAIMSIANKDDVKVIEGIDKLSLYQFHTKIAKHYFCSICGIYTHHQMRSNINKFGINTSCINGINLDDIKNVRLSDGINHPLDKK